MGTEVRKSEGRGVWGKFDPAREMRLLLPPNTQCYHLCPVYSFEPPKTTTTTFSEAPMSNDSDIYGSFGKSASNKNLSIASDSAEENDIKNTNAKITIYYITPQTNKSVQ